MADREQQQWVTAATYASGFEADVAVAALEARGVPARTRSNDIVGIFGYGFGGATARGVDVLVPAAALAAARVALASPGAAPDDIGDDDIDDDVDEQDDAAGGRR